MKISGLEHQVWLYSLYGLLGGFGMGIMFSNAIQLNLIWGFVIAIVSLVISIYIWNNSIKKYFIKN